MRVPELVRTSADLTRPSYFETQHKLDRGATFRVVVHRLREHKVIVQRVEYKKYKQSTKAIAACEGFRDRQDGSRCHHLHDNIH